MAGSSRKRSSSANGKSSRKKTKSETKMWSKKKASPEDQAAALFQELLVAEEPPAGEEDDPNTEIITIEGIAKLAEIIGIDPESDLRIMVLLWKVGALKPGALQRSEWIKACKDETLNTSNGWDSIKDQLPSFDTGFLTGNDFKDFYKFCFQFNRQGTHRTLDKDLVVALLQMVLKERVPADRLTSFCDFLSSLEGQREEQYSRITLDQWTSFWDFCEQVEDLSLYDESNSAWPVLIDEYVEYMEEKMKSS